MENELLPFQTTCNNMPEWLLNIFEEIDANATEITLKEFVSNTDIQDGEILRDMIIFDYGNNFRYYKTEYNGYPIYYYIWSAIEHFYYNSEIEGEE